jgi:hypothetical protein
MMELYPHEQQQTKLTEHSTLINRSKMPSFYPPSRHRTLITSHFSDHDDDDDHSHSIYKEEFILQIFQHWKIKTLEHQQALNNSGTNTRPNHFSQALVNTASPKETSSIETIPNETSLTNNKDEISNTIEPEKPITTMQKRVTPIPQSYARRKAALKKSISAPTEFLNPNLLLPHAKNKLASTLSTTAGKKSPKPGPIFIAPKKTQPSIRPRSCSLLSSDESIQSKRKSSSEKQNSPGDEQSVSPTWAPPRFSIQSPGSSIDDNEDSSDESDYESLLIRNKKSLKKTSKTKAIFFFPIPPNVIIPTAVLLTDPNGNSHTLDLNDDAFEDSVNSRRIIENIYPNNLPDHSLSSSSSIETTPSTSPVDHDKYALHSIGEEEEYVIEKNNNDGVILSKELNRIDAISRSRQINSNVQKKDTNRNQDENSNTPLGRRWSDSVVSDDEDHIEPVKSPLVKTTSTTSVTKQSVNPPVKLSRTKYLLMKLHLTSSPNKDDVSNTSSSATTNPPPSRKRTVRRSSDKKRYQTQ